MGFFSLNIPFILALPFYLCCLLLIASACLPTGVPCEADEACYPGIGCVRVEVMALEDCHGVCIDTVATPTLRCEGSEPCLENASLECPIILDSDLCYLDPLVPSDGSCAQQAALIECSDGQHCEPSLGCPSPLPTTKNNNNSDDSETVMIFIVLYSLGVILLLSGGCLVFFVFAR